MVAITHAPPLLDRQASTIGARLIETKGRTTGFDYIRIALAVSIIVWHAIIISYGPAVEAVHWRAPEGVAFRFVLPMFFALSGFLVAGSLDRCRTLLGFFTLRVLRIVPALAVETLLSALVFGPALTAATLPDYFTSPTLYAYGLNIIGDIHYVLPGLFALNPNPDVVNQQLWTVPSELQCYLVLGGLTAVALLGRRWALLVLVVACQTLWVFQVSKLSPGRAPLAPGPVLVIAFLCGILLHLFRDLVPLSRTLFLACLAAGIALATLPNGGVYLPFPAAYMTVFLGLQNPPSNRFLQSGDYSYGIYLYGYPIQQAVAAQGPAFQHWWVNVGIALPTALAIAVASWRRVEKPALAARRHIPVLEARSATLLAASPPRWPVTVFMQALAIAGIALIINGNEWPGATLVTAAMAGMLLLPRLLAQPPQPES